MKKFLIYLKLLVFIITPNIPNFLIWGGLSFDLSSAVLWGVQTYDFFIITGGWLRLLSLWILELVKTYASLLVAIPTCYMPDHNHHLLTFRPTLLLLCVCLVKVLITCHYSSPVSKVKTLKSPLSSTLILNLNLYLFKFIRSSNCLITSRFPVIVKIYVRFWGFQHWIIFNTGKY